jgi:RNA polymerase sigma-70 factor (ECF subfamily)
VDSLSLATAKSVPRPVPLTAEEFAQAYSERVHRFAAMACHGDQDSGDLAQEALIRAMRALPRFDPSKGHLEPWLWAIVLNCARDAGRASRRRLSLLERFSAHQHLSTEPNVETSALKKIADGELLALLRTLPLRQRTVVALRYGAGLTYAEIGHQMKTSERAAIMTNRRALQRLRSRLEVTE